MWVVYALGSALSQVLRNMAMKRLGHALDDTINVWGRFALIVPFTGVAVYTRGVPPLQEGFWWVCVAFALCQIVATLSLSRALKLSDISLVTTLWKLSLVFLVVWGFFTLGETPTPLGLLGILLSVAGVYLLNIGKSHIAWWAPFAALMQDKGQRWALISALFFAPSVILIKQLALLSDPYYASFMGYVVGTILLTPYTLYRSGRHFRSLGRYWLDFLTMGLFASLATVLGTIAITMTLSSYAESVKQVEILFALAVGYLVFNEGTRVRAILPGSLVMLIGVLVVNLWG
ncbi:MAG: DMT family transporter [SAR324 cluster bacterium]|nr:DMT family transporter [SAR324 cluster bacterium]MCZ6729254.1 DMT family transporter [SAR324 cluster bacterium]MCZ6843775.1 DMT family transporter [SAR324 cluster bacterium]